MMDVTRADLENLISRISELREDVRVGFLGVHKRQDVTNGHVNEHEVELARQDERLKSHEVELVRHDERQMQFGDEIFNRRSSDRRDGDRRADPGLDRETLSERSPITRRDAAIAVAALVAGAAVLKFLAWLLPALPVLRP